MPIVHPMPAWAAKLVVLHGQSSDQYLRRITPPATAIILITRKPLAGRKFYTRRRRRRLLYAASYIH